MTTTTLTNIGWMVMIGLLIISSCAYVVGLFILLTKRRIPSEVSPPRTEPFVALVLCAAKAILGPSIASYQVILTFLILLATGIAIFKMFQRVWNAFQIPEPVRSSIFRWSAVLIPPLASIGLLGILDTLPDQDKPMLINVFIAVNLIPAIFVIVNLKNLLLLYPMKSGS